MVLFPTRHIHRPCRRCHHHVIGRIQGNSTTGDAAAAEIVDPQRVQKDVKEIKEHEQTWVSKNRGTPKMDGL